MTNATYNYTKEITGESYQFIKGENLALVVVANQILSSTRVLLSTYEQVVFSECNFYACDFQGLTFENCVFENCTFEFSHFRACNFKNCSFSNCEAKGCSSMNSIYEACVFGQQFGALAKNGHNTVTSGRHDHSTDIYIHIAVAA